MKLKTAAKKQATEHKLSVNVSVSVSVRSGRSYVDQFNWGYLVLSGLF